MLRKLSSHTDILLCKGPSNGDGGVAGGTVPQEVDKARSWCQKPATALTKSWREGGGAIPRKDSITFVLSTLLRTR